MAATSGEDVGISPRAGSGAELSKRMDHMEQNHADLAREVAGLTVTVVRIEQNQTHASELNKVRFDSLDNGLKTVGLQLETFMKKMESLITGETQTAQMRSGQEMVEDYKRWRAGIDAGVRDQNVINGQLKLVGRIITIIVGGNALLLLSGLYWLVSQHP